MTEALLDSIHLTPHILHLPLYCRCCRSPAVLAAISKILYSEISSHNLPTDSLCTVCPCDWEWLGQLQLTLIARNAVNSSTFNFVDDNGKEALSLAHVIRVIDLRQNLPKINTILQVL